MNKSNFRTSSDAITPYLFEIEEEKNAIQTKRKDRYLNRIIEL